MKSMYEDNRWWTWTEPRSTMHCNGGINPECFIIESYATILLAKWYVSTGFILKFCATHDTVVGWKFWFCMLGAAQGLWINRFSTTSREVNYLNLGRKNGKLSNFYWICPKIDGLGRFPWTCANAAPELLMYTKAGCDNINLRAQNLIFEYCVRPLTARAQYLEWFMWSSIEGYWLPFIWLTKNLSI